MGLPATAYLPKNETVNQAISAAGGYVTVVRPNSRSAAVTISGTWSGTLQFFYSLDDVNWLPFPMQSVGSTTPVTSVTSNGTYVGSLVPVGAGFMVKASAWTSGSATVVAHMS